MYTFEYGKKLLKGKDSLEKMEDGIFLHCYIMNLSGKAQKIHYCSAAIMLNKSVNL